MVAERFARPSAAALLATIFGVLASSCAMPVAAASAVQVVRCGSACYNFSTALAARAHAACSPEHCVRSVCEASTGVYIENSCTTPPRKCPCPCLLARANATPGGVDDDAMHGKPEPLDAQMNDNDSAGRSARDDPAPITGDDEQAIPPHPPRGSVTFRSRRRAMRPGRSRGSRSDASSSIALATLVFLALSRVRSSSKTRSV